MSMFKKVGLGVALAASAITTAVPAEAQRYGGYHGYRGYHRHGGDVAGAALLGGIVGLGVGAAIADSHRDRYYDGGYYDGGYYYGPRYRGYYGPRYRYAPRGYYRHFNRGYYGRPYYYGY